MALAPVTHLRCHASLYTKHARHVDRPTGSDRHTMYHPPESFTRTQPRSANRCNPCRASSAAGCSRLSTMAGSACVLKSEFAKIHPRGYLEQKWPWTPIARIAQRSYGHNVAYAISGPPTSTFEFGPPVISAMGSPKWGGLEVCDQSGCLCRCPCLPPDPSFAPSVINATNAPETWEGWPPQGHEDRARGFPTHMCPGCILMKSHKN